jgi:hypothetical protein
MRLDRWSVRGPSIREFSLGGSLTHNRWMQLDRWLVRVVRQPRPQSPALVRTGTLLVPEMPRLPDGPGVCHLRPPPTRLLCARDIRRHAVVTEETSDLAVAVLQRSPIFPFLFSLSCALQWVLSVLMSGVPRQCGLTPIVRPPTFSRYPLTKMSRFRLTARLAALASVRAGRRGAWRMSGPGSPPYGSTLRQVADGCTSPRHGAPPLLLVEVPRI